MDATTNEKNMSHEIKDIKPYSLADKVPCPL
jgi:hypothetical protein